MKDINHAPLARSGARSTVSAGAHVCVIKEIVTDSTRNSAVLALEIAEDGCEDIFADRFYSDNPWARGVEINLVGDIDQATRRELRAITDSNPGFDAEAAYAKEGPSALVGRAVGAIFRRREYYSKKRAEFVTSEPRPWRLVPLDVVRANQAVESSDIKLGYGRKVEALRRAGFQNPEERLSVLEGGVMAGEGGEFEPAPMLDAALEYIGLGFAIIPVEPHGKVPLLTGWQDNWTDNPAQAALWWEESNLGGSPRNNIGAVCGAPSGGVICIDVDTAAHGGADGAATIAAWEAEHGPLPKTAQAETPTHGRHLLYRVRSKVAPSANPACGIDIRGDGSQCILAPSIHPNGGRYRWIASPTDVPIADADDNVMAFIESVRPVKKDGSRKRGGADGAPGRFTLGRTVGTGERNTTLFRYGCSLRAKGLGAESISIVLHTTNLERLDPPLPEGEVDSIVASVCKYPPGHSMANDVLARLQGRPSNKH